MLNIHLTQWDKDPTELLLSWATGKMFNFLNILVGINIWTYIGDYAVISIAK